MARINFSRADALRDGEEFGGFLEKKRGWGKFSLVLSFKKGGFILFFFFFFVIAERERESKITTTSRIQTVIHKFRLVFSKL